MTSFGFDVGNTKPDAGFDPLPTGWYAMFIVMAEQAVSKAGHPYIKMQLEIDPNAHPEFSGRKVFANFNHMHPNEQTSSIARSQIASICHAIGKPNATMLEDLLGGMVEVRLVAKPAENGYDARNEAKSFRKVGADDGPRPAQPAQPAAPAAAPAPAAKRGAWK